MAKASTKKTAAEETVEAVVPEVTAVETAAPEAAPVEKVKAAKKPRATKKAAAEEKPAAAPKATRAKKTDKITAKVVVELMDKSASADTLVERAKEDWIAKGNAIEDVKELALYINATESMVYYVVNDDYLSGSFAF